VPLVGGLDQLAQVHHRHPVADVLDHRQVVGDEQVRQPEAPLQVLQQVDHLRLDRDVERRDRLVADDQLRIDRQRARDADALALAARELVRVARACSGDRPDHLEQLAHPLFAFRPPVPISCTCSGSARMAPTVMRGLSARVRVLEDDLQVAAHRRIASCDSAGDLLALEAHRAAVGSISAGCAAGGGLAASGLADQRRASRPGDVEADVVDRLHRHVPGEHHAALDREVL
jgi:hypothetical protein